MLAAFKKMWFIFNPRHDGMLVVVRVMLVSANMPCLRH
jgi:hypothetical protein